MENSLKASKSQERITFRDFALPPMHGKKRLPERVDQPPRAECVVTQKIQSHLGNTEKKTALGDEINQKLTQERKMKQNDSIDVWKLP